MVGRVVDFPPQGGDSQPGEKRHLVLLAGLAQTRHVRTNRNTSGGAAKDTGK
jgi:hypothetical protein